jgi:hypothetical protein
MNETLTEWFSSDTAGATFHHKKTAQFHEEQFGNRHISDVRVQRPRIRSGHQPCPDGLAGKE